MSTKVEIKSRLTEEILFSAAVNQPIRLALRDALEIAVASGAYLSGADLSGADLSGADLTGAYLRGAYLSGAYLSGGEKLIGERPVFVIGPIGSRCDYLTAYLTDKGTRLRAGCFFGDVETFRSKLEAEHGDNDYAAEYRAALVLIEKHAEIWTPKEAAITKATGEAT